MAKKEAKLEIFNISIDLSKIQRTPLYKIISFFPTGVEHMSELEVRPSDDSAVCPFRVGQEVLVEAVRCRPLEVQILQISFF